MHLSGVSYHDGVGPSPKGEGGGANRGSAPSKSATADGTLHADRKAESYAALGRTNWLMKTSHYDKCIK